MDSWIGRLGVCFLQMLTSSALPSSIGSPSILSKALYSGELSNHFNQHVCLDHDEWGTRLPSDNGLPRSVVKGFTFFTHFCDCSVDTELIDRNNRAKNQFNGFCTSALVNGFLSSSSAFQFSSFQGAGGAKERMTAFGKVEHHSFSSFVPISVWLIRVSSAPFLLWSRSQKWPTSEQESANAIRSFSPYHVVVHWHEDDHCVELLRFTM